MEDAQLARAEDRGCFQVTDRVGQEEYAAYLWSRPVPVLVESRLHKVRDRPGSLDYKNLQSFRELVFGVVRPPHLLVRKEIGDLENDEPILARGRFQLRDPIAYGTDAAFRITGNGLAREPPEGIAKNTRYVWLVEPRVNGKAIARAAAQ